MQEEIRILSCITKASIVSVAGGDAFPSRTNLGKLLGDNRKICVIFPPQSFGKLLMMSGEIQDESTTYKWIKSDPTENLIGHTFAVYWYYPHPFPARYDKGRYRGGSHDGGPNSIKVLS